MSGFLSAPLPLWVGCATRRFEADRPLSGYERSLSRSIRGSTRLPGRVRMSAMPRRRTQPGPATLARGPTTRPPTLNDGLGDRESAASRGPCRCSDFGLLSELQRIVDLDAEVAHCALKSSVAKQQLHRPQVLRAPVDQ